MSELSLHSGTRLLHLCHYPEKNSQQLLLLGLDSEGGRPELTLHGEPSPAAVQTYAQEYMIAPLSPEVSLCTSGALGN